MRPSRILKVDSKSWVDTIRSMKKKHSTLLALLMFSFLFVAMHSSFHNSFHTHHDSSCSVYVLEELFVSGEFAAAFVIFVLFTPYLFLLFVPQFVGAKVKIAFPSRAPPSLF